MRPLTGMTLGLVLMIGGSVIAAGQASAAEKLSHAHMGHVTTAWNGAAIDRVVKAAGGTAKHINFAANSDDASDNVRAHARHVATAAQNTLARAAEIAALCQKVSTADNAEQAAALMQQVATLGNQLLAGVDANGDGAISWEQGEGGRSSRPSNRSSTP